MRRAATLLLVATALAHCGGGDVASAPPLAPVTTARPPPPRYDWIGVVGTGQSLSVGAGGRPLLSIHQPYRNLKLADLGPAPGYAQGDPRGALVLVPLVEPVRPMWAGGDGQYPGNLHGETPHTSMANQMSALAVQRGQPDTVSLHSVVGWSGHCMSDIDREGPGRAYPASLAEARAFKKMADVEGKTMAYAGVTLTHGECDSMSSTYETDLFRMWQAYDTDLRAITGQRESVVLLVSQQHSFPGDRSVPLSTLAAWSAGEHFPGRIVCAGPKYQYAYTPDNVHLDAASYRRLGEKYAEVLDQVFLQRQPWGPLGPRRVSRDGLVIRVVFHVPNPPLAWDETLGPPHQAALEEWSMGKGFEVETPAGRVPIAGVRIEGDAVAITLRRPPVGAPVTVRYAMTQDGDGSHAGATLGRRGQLCDSDPLVGWDAESLECNVEHGSNVVTAATAGPEAAFGSRTLRDVVQGQGLAAGTVVTGKQSDRALTLSSPWTGPSGTSSLSFRYDQRNYAVAFQLDVP
jgi:hypothetical protein